MSHDEWTLNIPKPTATMFRWIGKLLFIASYVALWGIVLTGGMVPKANWCNRPGPTPTPTPVPVEPKPEPKPPEPDKATTATYVYEKDQHTIPNQVLSALNRLNRERGVIATAIEADVKDGTGEVPAQYKIPFAAAKEAGLPALVVTAGSKVLAVVKDPKTEQQILEAVK